MCCEKFLQTFDTRDRRDLNDGDKNKGKKCLWTHLKYLTLFLKTYCRLKWFGGLDEGVFI